MTKKPINTTFQFLSLFSVILLFAACGKDSPKPVVVQPPAKKWVVTTVAGSTNSGSADGDTTQAQFNNLQGIVTDNQGSLYVGDGGNASIRKVSYAGHVTTYVSNTISNPNPVFGNISDLVRDSQGNLYAIDYGFIRKIASPTNIAVFAGQLTTGHQDGTGTNARFNVINRMTIDGQGNIFVPDYDTNNKFVIRKVTPAGVVSTLTIQDNTGVSSDGTANSYYNHSIAVDPSGNLYVTANGNCLIKKVDPSGNVTIFVGSNSLGLANGSGQSALFNGIFGMTCDATGNLWVCDNGNNAIRKVTPAGVVSTIAGSGAPGFLDGDAAAALFKYPSGITVDNNGILFVTDNGNNRIRRLEYK